MTQLDDLKWADPRWNPTYHFTSAAPVRTGRVHTHILSVYMTVDAYPDTSEAKRALAFHYGPHLVQEWVDGGLPLVDLYYLVHRPGELGPSEVQRLHRADQASGLAREFGGVPVVLALSNVPVDRRLVVSKVRFD